MHFISLLSFVHFQEFGIVDNEEYIEDKEKLNLTFRTRKEAEIVRKLLVTHSLIHSCILLFKMSGQVLFSIHF